MQRRRCNVAEQRYCPNGALYHSMGWNPMYGGIAAVSQDCILGCGKMPLQGKELRNITAPKHYKD